MSEHEIEDEIVRDVNRFKALGIGGVILLLFTATGTVISKTDEITTYVCSDRVELAAFKSADSCKDTLHKYQLDRARETGKVLRVDCDAEVSKTARRLQLIFATAITETSKRIHKACDAELLSCAVTN